jgi:SRSO17 transposase
MSNSYRCKPTTTIQDYLPKRWADDWARRKKAGVPREVRFRTKHEIALAQIDAAFCARRVRPAHLDYQRETPRDEEWLLIERPLADRAPWTGLIGTRSLCAGI